MIGAPFALAGSQSCIMHKQSCVMLFGAGPEGPWWLKVLPVVWCSPAAVLLYSSIRYHITVYIEQQYSVSTAVYFCISSEYE